MNLKKLKFSTIRFHGDCVLFDGKAYTNLTPKKDVGVEVFETSGGFVFKMRDTSTNTLKCTFVPATSVQSITYYEDISEALSKAND